MEESHATVTHRGGVTEPPDVVRWIVLPAAGVFALLVFMFTLLRGPIGDEAAPENKLALEPVTVATTMAEPEVPPCGAPMTRGQAGVISARFSGKKASSGWLYDPEEATCTVNSAGGLGPVEDGMLLRLTRSDDPARGGLCRVIGRWKGSRHPHRVVLVSSSVARALGIGDQGLVEVTAACGTKVATVSHSRS